MTKTKPPVKAIVEELLPRGYSEAAIRAEHPEINATSLHGAVQRYRRERGLTVPRHDRSIALSLPPDVAQALQADAKARGVSASDLAGSIVIQAFRSKGADDR